MLPTANVNEWPVLPQTCEASRIIIRRERAAVALVGGSDAEIMIGTVARPGARRNRDERRKVCGKRRWRVARSNCEPSRSTILVAMQPSERTSSEHAYSLRPATLADTPTLARQRRLMFDEIGRLPDAEGDAMEAAIREYIERALPAGTFYAWVVEQAGEIVAGGGLQLRTLMPRPGFVHGEPEGLIVSMWTEPQHRRRGLGRRVVEAILAWGAAHGFTRFTLHASEAGRPLYEHFGFRQTNEMRLESSTADLEAPA